MGYTRTGLSLGLLIKGVLEELQRSGELRDIIVNQAQQPRRPCVAYWCDASVTEEDKARQRETVSMTMQVYGLDYEGTTLLAEKIRRLFDGRCFLLPLPDGELRVDRSELVSFADIFEGDSYGKSLKFAMRLVRPLNG